MASEAPMPASPRASCSSPTSTSVTRHAGGRGHLRDAGAHLARADDHDRSITASTSITIASPCPPPEQIAARPRPPPRRRSS